jgi:plastocyanin
MPRSSRFHPLAGFVLAAVPLALALACGGGGSRNPTTPPPPPPPPPPTGQVVVVEVDDSFFSPRSVVIQPGDTVRWTFVGSAPGHTVTAENGSFDSGFAFNRNGATYERTFGADLNNTTIQYRCTSHKACCMMQGSVRVGEGAPPPDPGY